jgi:hypothetical protein
MALLLSVAFGVGTTQMLALISPTEAAKEDLTREETQEQVFRQSGLRTSQIRKNKTQRFVKKFSIESVAEPLEIIRRYRSCFSTDLSPGKIHFLHIYRI